MKKESKFIKVIVVLVLSLFLLIPYNVKAVSIKNAYITGLNEKKVGEELSVLVKINFSDLKKDSFYGPGIMLVGYELIYDPNVFTLFDIRSGEWESDVYKEDGKYYILSELGLDDPYNNRCANGVLYCSDYAITLRFSVRNTTVTSSTIKISDIEVGVLNVQQTAEEYTMDDVSILTTIASPSQTITIKPSTTTVVEESPLAVKDNKPEIYDKKIVTKKPSNNSNLNSNKSNNNYLSYIKLEKYQIDFDPNKTEYELTIKQNENRLNLKAKPQDEKATYKISGNDDLKANNYKVTIDVTAENGQKKLYTINIKQQEYIITNDDEKKEAAKFRIDQIDKKYLVIGSGIFIFVVLLLIIKNKISDKKLDKALEKF